VNLLYGELFESFAHFYLYHAIISFGITIASVSVLRQKFITPRDQMGLLIFVFNMVIPFFGYLFTFWIVYYLVNVTYQKELTDTSAIDMLEFENEFPTVTRLFGEGSMEELLTNGEIESSLRMKALVSLADNSSKENLRLIKNALSDKNDEIRLYSFAIIDNKERTLNEKIHSQIELFHEASSPQVKLKAAENLVYLYWDMIYFELSDSDLQGFLLQEIDKYAQMVLLEYPQHEKINIILGKMYLMEKRFDEAERRFTDVINFGCCQDFILPYLAEIYFNRREFGKVKSLFESSKTLHLNTLLNPILTQWKTQ